MVITHKPLFAMTARDLMSQPLVRIPQEMSLQGAAHLLSRANVTGAPVVDEEGRCVGVLSAMDFVHLIEKGFQPGVPCNCQSEEVFTSSQIVEVEERFSGTVREYMTADPVMVSPSTNIGELAQMMMNVHIHRVIVTNGDDIPLGIVSSLDILAAVSHAFQTQEMENSVGSFR